MLHFTGDICYTDNHFDIGFGVGSAIKRGNRLYDKIEKTPNDVWIGNFEGVCSDVSCHNDYHSKCFRLDTRFMDNLHLIDYYAIANNHVMEHGGDAYCQMQSVLNKNTKGCFGSKDKKSIVFEHDGKTIAITAFSLRDDQCDNEPLYWAFPDLSDIEKEYKSLSADIKVAYIHWGVEFVNYPSIEQIRLAHWLVDLGYDLIIGMHPHVMQGFEIYKGKHIFYSLGNFLFNMSYEPTKYSAVIGFDVLTGCITYNYIKIGEDYCPAFIDAVDIPNEYKFDYLNTLVGKIQNPENYAAIAQNELKNYRKSHHRSFVKNIFRFDLGVAKNIVFDFIKRRLKNGN